VVQDYASLSLSLKGHPMAFLRGHFHSLGYQPCAELSRLRPGARTGVAGLVLVRQRPGSAKGVIFATLEDETGTANVIIWPHVFARFRRAVIGAKLLGVTGELQREGDVIHLVAAQARDWSEALDALTQGDEAGGFQSALARADEVARPGADARERPKRKFAASEAESIIPASRDFR